MYDVNALRRYLQAGGNPEDLGMSQDQMTGTMTEPAPTGNALRQMIEQAQGNIVVGPNDYGPTGQSVPRINDMETTVYAPPGGKTHIGITDDPQLAAQNGWTLIGNRAQGAQGQSQGAQGAQYQGAQGRGGPMRVVGAGNGTTVDLSPEVAPARVDLDYSRAPVDVPGVGKVYYDKSGMGAYAVDGNGRPTTKVILGYDDEGSRARNKEILGNQKIKQDIAQSQSSVEHTQEQIRASKVNNPDYLGAGGAQAAADGLTGDAFLQTLDPQTRNEVKALANGDVPFNPRSQRQMQLLGIVRQYDPTFDATNYNVRNATKLDFSPKGKSGQAVQGINQALHHAETYSGAIDALNNSNVLPGIVNPVVNFVEQKLGGDVRQGNLMTAANALSEELKKIYAGGGGGSLAELQNWQKSFDPNAGQDQQRAYLKTGMDLLSGAIQSRKEAYERGMGPAADFNKLLSPQAQQAISKLQGGSSPQQVAPEQLSQIRNEARRAIQMGAPLEQVRARLRQAGVPDTGF